MNEVHRHLQCLLVRAIVLLKLFDIVRPGLADQHGVVLVGDLRRPAARHAPPADWCCTCGPCWDRRRHSCPAGWDCRVASGSSNRVSTASSRKPDDAAIVPEAGHVKHRVLHSGIAPVQVGLLRIEEVVIVLIGLRVELPGRSAKKRSQLLGGWFGPLPSRQMYQSRYSSRARRARVKEPLCWSEVWFSTRSSTMRMPSLLALRSAC